VEDDQETVEGEEEEVAVKDERGGIVRKMGRWSRGREGGDSTREGGEDV